MEDTYIIFFSQFIWYDILFHYIGFIWCKDGEIYRLYGIQFRRFFFIFLNDIFFTKEFPEGELIDLSNNRKFFTVCFKEYPPVLRAGLPQGFVTIFDLPQIVSLDCDSIPVQFFLDISQRSIRHTDNFLVKILQYNIYFYA